MSTEPCGRPKAHPSPWVEAEPGDGIEIVESIEMEGVVDEGSSPVALAPTATVALVEPALVVASPITELLASNEPALATAPPIETLEELILAMEPEEVHAPEPAPLELEDEHDPYATFIRTLAEVAVASGADLDALAIDELLESDEVASAWRAILRGESEDFSHCAGTLDEWAANALASLLSAPQKAGQLRRELRARGVAAFGLIDGS